MKSLTSLIAVSVVSAFTFAAPLFADMKGGERLMTLYAPEARVEASAPAAKMTCPVEMRTSIDQSACGATKPVSVYTAHLCGSCKTTEVKREKCSDRLVLPN